MGRGARVERPSGSEAGRILKADAARPPGGLAGAGKGRVAAEVYDAAQRARAILSAAEAEAERIRQAAAADGGCIRAKAAEAGREEGLCAASAALVRAAMERDRILASAERDLLRLALAVAGKILRRELARDEEAVVEMASRALAEVRQHREVALRVHPADAEALRRSERRLLGVLSRARAIDIREDPGVGRGGILVETEAGVIDARLESQLEAIRCALEEGGRP
jgi:flagellar biosynthesis/type III secretory pathway protein FliH